MQTYYDPTAGLWVTRDDNGAVRHATYPEMTAAVAGGASATGAQNGSGPGGQYDSANSLRWAGGGTGSGPGGTYSDSDSTRWTKAALPPAPAPPPPPQIGWGNTPAPTNYGWGTGFRGSQAGAASPFADLSGTQQAYYQLHPDQANYLLRSWLAPNLSSPLNQYLAGKQADMTNDFATASAQSATPNLQYTDWLKQNFGKYVDQFAGQSASQRGENPLSFGGGFAGRSTF